MSATDLAHDDYDDDDEEEEEEEEGCVNMESTVH